MHGSRKGTYPVDVVRFLPVALRDAVEVGVDRGTELKLLLPDLVLVALGADEVLRDASQDDCPAHPFTGRPSPETDIGSSRHQATGAASPSAELNTIVPEPSGRSTTAVSGASATGYAGSPTACASTTASIAAGSAAAPSSLATSSSGTGPITTT